MNPFYSAIKASCEVNAKFSEKLIDKYLIYYAADRSGLEKKMNQQLKRYRHIAKQISTEYVNILKSEYLAAQIFKHNGLIGRYLKHQDIKALPADEYAFLEFQYQHFWRHSFAVILKQPEKDFYLMLDVFTEEEYLLYSPGMTATLAEVNVHLWFNLIAFNGECWQTFGLIVGFNGFTDRDIFFFATELNPDIEDGADVMQEVEKNPWPFYLLLYKSRLPLLESQGERVVYHMAEDDLDAFSYEDLKNAFKIRWKANIYALTTEALSPPPHFATAYIDESKQIIHRFASTETGFDKLTEMLAQNGIALDPTPMAVVSPAMLITTQEILKRKIELNPYQDLFVDLTTADDEELEKMNRLLELALPYINNNDKIDVEKLAAEAGMDVELAQEILEKALSQIRKLKDQK